MKTREQLKNYHRGMSLVAACRAYCGMVETGECTMQDLQVIPHDIYRMVESYFAAKRLAEPVTNECNMLSWLESHDFAVIDDSQVIILRRGPIDVHYDSGNEWRVIVHTETKARLIRYEMQFSIATPSTVIQSAIAEAYQS